MMIKQYQPPKVITIITAENEPEKNEETGAITWDNTLTDAEVQGLKNATGAKFPNLIAWNSIIQRYKAGMSPSEIARQLRRQHGCSMVQIKRVLAAWNKINGTQKEFRYRGKS